MRNKMNEPREFVAMWVLVFQFTLVTPLILF